MAGASPYDAVEMRGIAEPKEDASKTLSRELSQRYLGDCPPPEPADVVRLIVQVSAQKVSVFSA